MLPPWVSHLNTLVSWIVAVPWPPDILILDPSALLADTEVGRWGLELHTFGLYGLVQKGIPRSTGQSFSPVKWQFVLFFHHFQRHILTWLVWLVPAVFPKKNHMKNGKLCRGFCGDPIADAIPSRLWQSLQQLATLAVLGTGRHQAEWKSKQRKTWVVDSSGWNQSGWKLVSMIGHDVYLVHYGALGDQLQSTRSENANRLVASGIELYPLPCAEHD